MEWRILQIFRPGAIMLFEMNACFLDFSSYFSSRKMAGSMQFYSWNIAIPDLDLLFLYAL